jgi:dihydrofolate reductase
VSDIAVAIIAAVARNGVIGADGAMPWRLSSDLRRFKALTLGHPVVMGRRTFESIGRPLPGRTNIVISRRPDFAPEGAVVVASLEAALEEARRTAAAAGVDTLFVIGGGEIYRAALPHADRLLITHVDAAPEGDTRFPAIEAADWAAGDEDRTPAGANDSAATRFVNYGRRETAASR